MDLVNQPQSQQGDKYEVFLSFSRGEDTQESFSSLLCSSLKKAGISTLKDDDISNDVLRSIIPGSRIAIIIFSKHYASSKRCLEVLTKIMEFRIEYDHVIFPIYYGVDQSEVRNQESSFGEAFRDLIQRISPSEDEVSKWRAALKEAGGRFGLVMPNFVSKIHRGESEIIREIVENVRDILEKDPFRLEDIVGVSSQVKEVIAKLEEHKSEDVVSIGIWGMGGIGKTTLAKVIFMNIQYEFESTCFLANVRKTWKTQGKVYLQEKFLSKIGEERWMGTTNSIGSTSIDMKARLCNKKVLVVLDDVDDLEQLEALYEKRKWFGQGSAIIITTRDAHILKASEVVDHIYLVKELSNHDALELFCRYAFRQASPIEEYSELYGRIVDYCKGHPLALKELGSSLKMQSYEAWEFTLKLLMSIGINLKMHDGLKRSFDSLDDGEKKIFLNILFYIGEDMNDVIQKLNDHGCNATNGMRVLVDKSLVTIDENKKLRMHDLLQLIGRRTLRETLQNELQNQGHRYDVFLSFRGEDTRATFTSHLYSALCNSGIVVFKDDVDLPRGHHIKTELLKAITSSKISIVIFSKKYAESKWCLEELSIIMELHKLDDRVVLPVFYDVDPTEIRNQTYSFGEAFKDLIQRISPPEYQVSHWKATLKDAGSMAGIVVLGSGDESKKVENVVEDVCNMLDKKDLFVVEHPVGVGDRVQEVITMIQNHQLEDVAVMVGLWGIGGIGKTTIAKAIYNEIGHTFESRSYISKIRKVWRQKGGKVRLQNQLLAEICKPTKIKIKNIESGKITLRDRLCHKKVFVVLDDVDKLAQLKALVGSRDDCWFKRGSIIIITTRNKGLLVQMNYRDHQMKDLDERESIELFSWHAFKQESPEEDFKKLARDIVAYSGGLPLALEVLGSYLYGRKVEEWKQVLKKLQKIPNEKIQKKLKISFDGLHDFEREIFLDICCFFVGMDKNDVTQILNGCKFFADIGINTLVERSLVTIDEKNKLGMHDLLRDMGREIIRKQSQNEPGERSRIWFHKDARDVLLKGMGTEAIEGLSLKLSQSDEKMPIIMTKAFKKMKRLRLLHLDNVQLRGDYKFISEGLRWLCWHGFPEKYIPRNFYQQKLVAVDLEYSSLTQVWKETQLLKKMKILNLSHSHFLVQTPNFSTLPNLEKLVLKDCPSLSMIHPSIGLLDKLLLLNLEDCIGLTSLPRSIYRLTCLNTLILSGCMNIEKLEEDIEQMISLTTLIAPAIKQVPFSLMRLKSILYLSVYGHEGLSRHVIPSLCQSWMSPTKNPLSLISTHTGMPSSILLDMLNNICGYSSAIPSGRIKRQSLLLEDGLQTPDSQCGTTNCTESRHENYLGHLLIQIGKNSPVFCNLLENITQGLDLTKHSDDCILPGDNYPYWLTFKGEGTSVKFKVPQVNRSENLKGMSICCVYCSSGDDLSNKACESCNLMLINYTKGVTLPYTGEKLKSLAEEERKEIISNLEPGDLVEVMMLAFGKEFTLKKTIVYLIYNESFDENMESSTSEASNLTGTKHKCEEENDEEAHDDQFFRPRKVMKI